MGLKKVAVYVAIFGVIYYVLTSTPISDDIFIDHGYKATNIEAPILVGMPLYIASKIIKIPLIGELFARFIVISNKIYTVRDMGYNLNVPPMYQPIRILNNNELEYHKNAALKMNYKDMLKSDVNLHKIIGKPSPNQLKMPFITVEKIYNLYKSGAKTPNDVIKEAIEAKNKLSHLNMFIQFNETDVLLQAKQSSIRWEMNKQISILDGIPIAIKDEFAVKGYYTTQGSKFLGDINGISLRDNDLVKRLRDLGAIIFGKTNMHEIGLNPNGYNPYYGSARNPYGKDSMHDTGGSSSGSAAVVSCGIVPMALGGDGGGSIRIPSGLTGIVGLKTGYGRTNIFPAKSGWSCLTRGILASNVRDQIIGYMAIAGEVNTGHITDNSAINPPIHLDGFNKQKDLKDITSILNIYLICVYMFLLCFSNNNICTVGIFPEWNMDSQESIRYEVNRIINALKDEYNVNIVHFTIPNMDILNKAHTMTILSEWIGGLYKIIDGQSINGLNFEFSPGTTMTLKYAKQFSVIDLFSALKVRRYFFNYIQNEIFTNKNIDVIITPTTGIVSPKYNEAGFDYGILDTQTLSEKVKFAFIGNFLGLPGISQVIGYTNIDGNGIEYNDGSIFPIGLQMYCNHYNENILFRIANIIESKLVKHESPSNNNKYVYSFDN